MIITIHVLSISSGRVIEFFVSACLIFFFLLVVKKISEAPLKVLYSPPLVLDKVTLLL